MNQPDPRTPFVDSEPPRVERQPYVYVEEPWQTDVELTADERVRTVVLQKARIAWPGTVHICETTQVTEVLGNDGHYGCDTGCIQPYLEVTLNCEHFLDGFEWIYRGGITETLADFIEEMAGV